MADYFTSIASTLGISLWIVVVLFVWSSIWKVISLWKSARNNSLVWFIVLAITNTLGILPILYIFIFSKRNKSGQKTKKTSRKKKR